jgi:hypothetical protein
MSSAGRQMLRDRADVVRTETARPGDARGGAFDQ